MNQQRQEVLLVQKQAYNIIVDHVALFVELLDKLVCYLIALDYYRNNLTSFYQKAICMMLYVVFDALSEPTASMPMGGAPAHTILI